MILAFLTSAIGAKAASSGAPALRAPLALDGIWSYRRTVTVANPGGLSLSNYQVMVTLNSAFDFTKANSDGSDIRFKSEDGTSLSYWIESWNPTGQAATLWVKIPSVPAGGISIYLYYGNPTAISESNGNTTFPFFDDFNTGSVPDAIKWGTFGSGASVSGSNLVVSALGGGVYSKVTFLNKAMRTRARYAVVGDYGSLGFNQQKVGVGTNTAAFTLWPTPAPTKINTITGGSSTFTMPTGPNADTSWSTWDIRWKAGEVKFLVDGALRQTHTTNIPMLPLNVQFNEFTGGAVSTINADWVLVREYSSPEPDATVGTEEAIPLADLSIAMIGSPDSLATGEPLTYTVTVTNHGPNAATAIISDNLPAGMSFNAGTSSPACSAAGSLVTCNPGVVENGSDSVVDIGVTPATAGSITNTATVSSPEFDPDMSNNSASVTTTVALSPVPWFNTAWTFRRPVAITNSGVLLNNYQVQVSLDATFDF